MRHKLVLKDENGVESTDDRFFYDDVEDAIFFEGVDLRLGDGTDTNDGFPEGGWDEKDKKLTSQEGLICGSRHDSIDIGLGRAGNNGVGTIPVTTPPGQRQAWIYGRSYVVPPAGLEVWRGWAGGGGHDQFSYNIAIDFGVDGQQTPTSRPGVGAVYLSRPGEYAGGKIMEFKNATQPGETFQRWAAIDNNGNVVRDARVWVDENNFVRLDVTGAPPPPPPPPPRDPPTGLYRFLRFEVSKIVSPQTSFRLVDVQFSADGGATLWPTMTGLNAPAPFVASASSETVTDPAWEGMDGNFASTIWNTTQVSGAAGELSPPAWIQIDFGDGNGLTPDLLRYYPTNSGGDRTVVDGRLLGSDTGLFAGEETVLLTISGETSKPHAQPVDFTIP